ncbi:Alpha-L-AF-C domain-containing protein [Mycena sanguinolenta]|uniref:non-reducing end alpha-L-arabinofuranosidase n=1 Tax=Mycena sanguinolenta TaxID=230812 RepID=A0A8H6X4B6_9AGAR|nr:Alpha-L-AF-C domain-containing protein [Mycena sanguinolenta]
MDVLVLAVLLAFATRVSAVTTVSVSASASHAIPTTLYGQMFEDISSGDGGLYAECNNFLFFSALLFTVRKLVLQNRAFQQVTPNTADALNAWTSIGSSASITVIADPSPLSSALPNSLLLSIPPDASGELGFANGGYWGIKVAANTDYTASLYYRLPSALPNGAGSPILTLALQAEDGTRLAAHSTPLLVNATEGWTHISAVLTPIETPPSTANSFTVTVAGFAPAGLEVHFALLSLFPPTFKGRVNGMRADIAETLAEMRPAFWRFPGGNNLEASGQTTATRWQWRNTVGPLTERPGRVGDWTYVNTDGLGLLEYLLWCEDMEMEPFMAVWDGYSLDGTSITGAALEPLIAEAIDQINFVIGDPATSEAAALRASLGRSEPFALTYVEIGNEDNVGRAPGTYASRWNSIVTNLTATFPQLHFMATSLTTTPVLTPTPQIYDIHLYQTPKFFSTDSFFYDSFVRNGMTFFEGEYAATSTNNSNLFGTPDQGRLLWPTVAGSVGEAAFMTGLERNADIVFAASYAPLLGHVNGSQWTPNLVGFDAGNVYKSTSFYVQKLFSLNKGDEYLPSTLPNSSTSGTLFWSVTRWNSTGELIIKISNSAASPAEMTFVLPFETVTTMGTAQVITGAGTASNTPEEPNLVTPTTAQIPTGATFNYTAPAISVTVITLSVQ